MSSEVLRAVGQGVEPLLRHVELRLLLVELVPEREQRVEELRVVADDVAGHQLGHGLVLDPGQRRRLEHPAAERLAALRR